MRQKKTNIDALLAIRSRQELRDQTTNWSRDLSLPNALALTKYLRTLEASSHGFNLGIIHTYTSDLLDPWLDLHAVTQGLKLHTYHAPYGMNIMESQDGSGLVLHKPDLTLFLLTHEDLHPDLKKPISEYTRDRLQGIREEATSNLIKILNKFRSNVSGQLALTILPRTQTAALGLYDAQADCSEYAWWSSLKKDIAASLQNSIESSMFIDLDQMLAELGRSQFFDLRYWYTSRFPFAPQAANELARRIISLATVIKYPKAKVIVLDADNTLWGGIVGEDGINGIALGPEYPGNTYVDFQRRLLDYQKRGFILAICSKNNPEDVQEVLTQHPHQILREHHFAARRVNWLSKHENLISLAEELNLGLDSFIFVDDSDHECAIVRSRLPQVQVIQTPNKPIEIPACLEHVARLEILSLTEEDLQKTQLYAQEHQRKNLQKELGESGNDIHDYLVSLQMKMTIKLNSKENIDRLTQLTQKTNQFNLTTRRYDQQQMLQFIASDDWTVASFSLADIFGNSGIVGLMLSRRIDSSLVEIDSFLMSCRVIGRQAETAFLKSILAYLASNNVTNVVADYLPTKKNQLVSNFYKDHGFILEKNGRYRIDLHGRQFDKASFPPIEIIHETEK
ncbi:MAG: HAD-IIIC family phosphatase [Betaproteobacteria bacterium]|nr:HAD-IIIC family phosphatase [Betaproteobacteria bacterium]